MKTFPCTTTNAIGDIKPSLPLALGAAASANLLGAAAGRARMMSAQPADVPVDGQARIVNWLCAPICQPLSACIPQACMTPTVLMAKHNSSLGRRDKEQKCLPLIMTAFYRCKGGLAGFN
jgi:hypothetical protein